METQATEKETTETKGERGMKAKRTIRRMRGLPTTRKLAKYQRELASLQKRLTKIIDEVEGIEFDCAAYRIAEGAAKSEIVAAQMESMVSEIVGHPIDTRQD
jgi:uncharacterized protein YlxW (UPF0749 family)